METWKGGNILNLNKENIQSKEKKENKEKKKIVNREEVIKKKKKGDILVQGESESQLHSGMIS